MQYRKHFWESSAKDHLGCGYRGQAPLSREAWAEGHPGPTDPQTQGGSAVHVEPLARQWASLRDSGTQAGKGALASILPGSLLSVAPWTVAGFRDQRQIVIVRGAWGELQADTGRPPHRALLF